MTDRRTRDESTWPAYQRHSIESIAAGVSMAPHVSRVEQLILDLVASEGPLCDKEMSEALDIAENTVRPRRIALLRRGLLVRNGTTTTASGRRAATWGLGPAPPREPRPSGELGPGGQRQTEAKSSPAPTIADGLAEVFAAARSAGIGRRTVEAWWTAAKRAHGSEHAALQELRELVAALSPGR